LTVRWYAVAVVLAAAAIALVLWQLEGSASTTCFRSSVELVPGGGAKPEGCDKETADAVATAVEERTSTTEPTALEARAALVVWMALFAATAGVAAFSAVRSVAMIKGLRPAWNHRFIALSAGAVILVVLPFVLFWVLGKSSPRFGPFDDLHLTEIHRLNPIVAALTMPAVVGLVAVADVVATKPAPGLGRLAELGSSMRQLINMLGAIIALGVLTTAARWQAIGTLPGGESLPSTAVLLWGAVFALVLGVLYVPVYQLWAAATVREIAKEVERQLPDNSYRDGTPGFRAAELALKKELEGTLGIGGALRSLQGSVAVLAPVIAAAVSSLFA
jgi:hypothetical protein